MILNVELFFKSGLTAEQFLMLLIIKNKAYEKCEGQRAVLNELFLAKLVEVIKGKPKDPPHMKARLTKKGRELLRDLEIPGITEEVKEIGTELIELYKAKGYDKKCDSTRKIMVNLAWFMSETECNPIAITSAVDKYLGETEETYVSALDNLIYKPANLFTTYKNLGDSKLMVLINNS